MEEVYPDRFLDPNYVSKTFKVISFSLKSILRPEQTLHVTGTDNLPPKDPYVLAFSHHASWWDTLASGQVIYNQFKRPVRYMAKEDLFKNPILGPTIRALGGLSVSKYEFKLPQIKAGVDSAKNGNIVGVGVEGTREYGPILEKIKRGAAIIASLSNVRMVPVAVRGQELNIRQERPTIVPPLYVVYGESVEVADYSDKYQPEDLFAGYFPRDLLKAISAANKELRKNLQSALDIATLQSGNTPR